MKEIIFNIILVSITFLIVYKCYKTSTTIVFYTVKTKYKLYKILHKYYNLFFIILFIISLLLFSGVYFTHTKNVEKRFDNALKSYEQSLSNIFNNLSTNNYTNESIVPNTSSSCTSDRISINNNNIMNMSEGDGFDKLEKSFEIGLDLLKASLSEIMKNSNDVLTFWFAFLSVIMVVFTFAGILINNNVLEQSKTQLKLVEKEARESLKNIEVETQKLIEKNNKYMQISNLFNLGIQAANSKDYKLAEKYFSDIINLNNSNSKAYNNRGNIKVFLGNLEEAIKDFNKAIELNPYLSETYNNRGNAKNNFGNTNNNIDYLKEAIKDYNKAIELNPNNSEAYFNRYISRSLLLAKIVDKNSEEYKKAFDDAYNDLYTAYNLADEQLKVMIKNQVIGMAMSGNEVAIKFCEDKGWI